jgi:hypothetical protein
VLAPVVELVLQVNRNEVAAANPWDAGLSRHHHGTFLVAVVEIAVVVVAVHDRVVEDHQLASVACPPEMDHGHVVVAVAAVPAVEVHAAVPLLVRVVACLLSVPLPEAPTVAAAAAAVAVVAVAVAFAVLVAPSVAAPLDARPLLL